MSEQEHERKQGIIPAELPAAASGAALTTLILSTTKEVLDQEAKEIPPEEFMKKIRQQGGQ